MPRASIPVCLSGKHNVTSSFLAEATVEGEDRFQKKMENQTSVNRLEGLGGEKGAFSDCVSGRRTLAHLPTC